VPKVSKKIKPDEKHLLLYIIPEKAGIQFAKYGFRLQNLTPE
jgi:hypothetical protein